MSPPLPARYFVVDVFAEQRYTGNPLAVVLSDVPLADARMQLVAAEANYSETTFVTPAVGANGSYRVRIFTPAREIAFAGHPILGTAWVLRHFVAAGMPQALVLDLPVGSIRVTFETEAQARERAWFAAPASAPGPIYPIDSIAEALGIAVPDIDPGRPVQQVTAGVSALLVPVRDLDALHRCRVSTESFARLASLGLPSLVHFHCRQSRDPGNDFAARFFFEAHGAREDPATGNGAAFLGAYLLEHRLIPPSGRTLRIEQGHEIGRPSLVLLRARDSDGKREVWVGGGVILTVRGELA